MHPEFPPVAFLAAFSLLLPLPWHWRARNVATLSIIAWLFVSNIIAGVNAIMWGDNVEIKAVVWCDITTKIVIGANFALPAACLCICIHLEQVASVRMARTTMADKRRRQIFEGLMCFGLPMLFMALHYIVQGHRFDIIEEYGCQPTTYFSIPAIFIVWLPPILLSTVSLVFAALALRHFMIRRMTFSAHLNASNSALTTSRYLRLIAMSITQMVWSLAVTSYTLYSTTVGLVLRPYTSWADVHVNFSRIGQFITLFTPRLLVRVFYGVWWMIPASTIVFVAFFSFGHDAMEEYKKCFAWCRSLFRRSGPKSPKGSLPLAESPKSSKFSLQKAEDGILDITVTETPSSYKSQFSPPPFMYRHELDAFDYNTQYDPSTPTNSVGQVYDLTPPTPSTPYPPSPTPFFPSTTPFGSSSPPVPPPAVRRPEGSLKSPTSPRPFTYPSYR